MGFRVYVSNSSHLSGALSKRPKSAVNSLRLTVMDGDCIENQRAANFLVLRMILEVFIYSVTSVLVTL